MVASGTTRAVLAALAANIGIAIAKFAGYLLSGSAAMLGESVHSVVDTTNELLLMVGERRSRRTPDALHQFGYGRSRYFYSFVVALMLFSLGSAFAIYQGYRKIMHPEPLSAPLVALAILVVSAVFEGFSLRTARTQSLQLKGAGSWWAFIRNSRTPELPVVLLEDTGALVGLGLAFIGVACTAVTGDGLWDGLATVGIGILLGGIAVLLIVETQSLLIGEGATGAQCAAIRSALAASGHVDRVVDLRTQYLAPDQLLVLAKVAFDPGVKPADIAEITAAAEAKVRAEIPTVCQIYLRSDVVQP